MADSGTPRYPNTKGTFGTSLAVVTALMASISTAVVVVFSADQAAQARLGFLPLTPDQVGTITGSLAILFFVAATLACVYAQASNRYEVPQAVMDRWLSGRTDKDDLTDLWDHTGNAAYRFARIVWIPGVSLFLLTLGTLAYGKVRLELVVAGVIAMVASLLNFTDPEFRRPVSFLVTVLVIAASGIVCTAAAWAIWSSPEPSSMPAPVPSSSSSSAPAPTTSPGPLRTMSSPPTEPGRA